MSGLANTGVPVPHVFVAGSERALGLLRRAVSDLFICHLPVDGEACLSALRRATRRVLWLSPWAIAHAEMVTARLLDASFVVIDGDDTNTCVPSACRCLRLSEASLVSTPEREVARLLAFLDS